MRNWKNPLRSPGIGGLILSVLMMLCLVHAQAQTITGSLTGVVTDAKGSVVVGAKVNAVNVATGVTTSTTTNGSGIYSIRFLQIGQYKVSVEAPGFNKADYGPFSLEIDQTAKIDIPLTVGSAATTVTVDEQMQPILNTESPTLGETFTENTINSIPLNGRDFTQLTVYTPGAVAPGFSSFGGGDSNERAVDQGNEVSVNGNRQESNNYLLDGQEINENINNTLGYNPSPDALEQIRVISSNANAEFGNVNGGTILAVMKSGTNKFHGSVFAFLHNYNLDANSWGNDNNIVPLPKNPYTNTQFGGTFGGPIFKDKLFFFIDYLALRYHGAGVTTADVAPAAFRTGDLSSLGYQLYDTQHLGPDGKPIPYVNNQIPITNPVAKYLFSNTKAYPLPNHAPNANDPLGIQGNFVGPTGSFSRNDQGDVKIDWKLKDSDSFAFRYSQGYAQDGQTTDPLPVQFPIANNYPDHFFDTNWRHTFSPSIVNLFTANYGRIRFNNGVSTDPSGIFGLTGNQLVGIPGNPQQTAGFSSQNMNGTGGAGHPDGFGTNPSPEIFIDNIFGYSDYLTWQKGRHLLKFGGEFLRYQQNSFYPGNDGELGAFNYNGQFTSSPFDASSTPYPFADFLVDRVQDVQIGAVTGRTGQRQWRDGIFAQDDFKAMSNLTINIGLRWEFDQPIYEVNNKEANINMQTKQIIYAGVDGNSRALYDPTYTQFQPRVGFAYQPTPKTVIRGGYGISSYIEGTGANLRLTQNPPFHTDFEQIATNPVGTADKKGNVISYSPGVFFQASNGFPTAQVPTTTFYVWPKNFKAAMTQEFSLTTEYEITSTSSLQVGYVGILGHHLTDPYWGNQDPAIGVPGPYDNIVGEGGVIKITGTESASNYNGLQAIFRQRYKAGLELTANYTYSKSLTDDIGFYGVSNIGSGQYYQQNAYDMTNEWGPAGSDTRHNISVTGVYELPFGQGKMFGSHWNYYTNSLLGGWKLSGADVYYSGFPVTVSSPAHYSSTVNAYTGAARPNQLNPLHPVHRSISAYYGTEVQPVTKNELVNGVSTPVVLSASCGPDQTVNGQGLPCVYQEQSNFGFGKMRPGSLRAPSFQNIDMSLAKTFGVWRENKIAFRVDAFNLFNIADYAAPDSGMTDSNFGQITGTVNGNRSLSLSLKYQF
ncbi:TonB-dependent receptor [Acidicapsa ligni]|uniref:TonB-dependent receptor n=1 Tax=Acidicapsa ligni TaxID=542300 RepID=UPI0021E0D250|nr:TonB-dependent receptor [Acidicapsa ligni]